MLRFCTVTVILTGYCGINSKKSQVSGAGNVSEVRLVSPIGRVREIVCAQVSVFQRS
jgi:hypothetical protein